MALITLTKLRSFLGLTNYYCGFILGFYHIAWPPSQVTKGGSKAKFVWDKPQHKTFGYLEHHLCSILVLTLPDLPQPFEIETNALDYVPGAILTHHGYLVGYYNETLSDAVCKHPIYD